MTTRIQWSYTDSAGVEKTEDISIQSQGASAIGASASRKINPDYAQVASDPMTDGWTNEKPTGQGHTFQFGRADAALLELEKRGIMHWSTLTDYAVPAIVWGSDGKIYSALQASGPGTATKDPISEPDYWRLLSTILSSPPRLDFDYTTDINVGGATITAGNNVAWPITQLGASTIIGGSVDGSSQIILPGGYKYKIWAATNLNPGGTTPQTRCWIAKASSPTTAILTGLNRSHNINFNNIISGILDLTGETSPVTMKLYVKTTESGAFGFPMNILFREKYAVGHIIQTDY